MEKSNEKIIEEAASSWQKWAENQCEALADRMNTTKRDPRFMMKLGPMLERYHCPESCADHVLRVLMETVSGEGATGIADPREVIMLTAGEDMSCKWRHKSCKITINGLEFRVYMPYSGWGEAIGIGLERPYPMKNGISAESYAGIIRLMGEMAALFEEKAKEVKHRFPYKSIITRKES